MSVNVTDMDINGMINTSIKDILRYLIVFCLFVSRVAIAESEMNLARTVQNPLAVNPEARHFTLPFVNYTNFGYGTHKNTQNILDLKPVMPFPFTPSTDVILRTIIPFPHQPVSGGYINGLGDINPTIFFTPSENRSILWGVGPTVIIPTATNKALGAGKWSIGPELVLIAMPSSWTLAILTNNIWSVAGDASRAAVNEFTFQYFVTYNFSHGYFVSTQPVITSNWLATPSQKWTVPFGVGVGRMFNYDKQPMSLLCQGYYNAIRPHGGPAWTLELTFEFLFPARL